MSRFFVNTREGSIMLCDIGPRDITIPGRSVVDTEALGDEVVASYQWKKFVAKGLLMPITEEQAVQLSSKGSSSKVEPDTPRERETIVIDLEEDLRAHLHDHDEVIEDEASASSTAMSDEEEAAAIFERILRETESADVAEDDSLPKNATVLNVSEGIPTATKVPLTSSEVKETKIIDLKTQSLHHHES